MTTSHLRRNNEERQRDEGKSCRMSHLREEKHADMGQGLRLHSWTSGQGS